THDLAWMQTSENAHQATLYAKRDIALVRGEGAYLYDSDGKRYLDAMSNYGVASRGHADPGYRAALTEQLGKLTTCHQSFYNDARAEFLDALMAIAPDGLTRAFLSNSGAEAIEAAIKFAKATTGRQKFVALKRAYHGRTLGALAVTHDPKYRGPFEPLFPETIHIGGNDLDALDAAIDVNTAAVILEPIQGEAGIYPLTDEFLQAARRLASERGALLIADEIQTGFRTGAPWAITHAGVSPDILVTAKAVANGFPIGVTLMTESIGTSLPGGAHGSTFGANPLACAAGTYTLKVLASRYERNAALGAEIVERILALDSPKVRAVRGRGLMMGVELKERVTPTLRALQDRGILVLPAGALVFRLLPPLIWEREQADELLDGLEAVLSA
ncbi:MAG: aspartate aminotransferase family protein, partial [Thermomicrobiales bacterium]